MEEIDFILDSTKESMEGSLAHLEKEFLNIRAGKASRQHSAAARDARILSAATVVVVEQNYAVWSHQRQETIEIGRQQAGRKLLPR